MDTVLIVTLEKDIIYGCLKVGEFTDGVIPFGGRWDWEAFIQNRKDMGKHGLVAKGAYTSADLEKMQGVVRQA